MPVSVKHIVWGHMVCNAPSLMDPASCNGIVFAQMVTQVSPPSLSFSVTMLIPRQDLLLCLFVCLFFNHRQPTAATHLLFTLFKDSSSGTPSNQRKTPIHVPNFAPLSPPPAAAGGFSPMVNTPRGQGWDPILLLGHPTHSPLQPSLWLDTLTWTSGAHQERAAGSP